MFNHVDRIKLKELTIEGLIKALEEFPRDTKVHTNGVDTMFIHTDKENNSICIDSDDLDWLYFEEELSMHKENIPSSTYMDCSPGNPWDAPGMAVSDFIR